MRTKIIINNLITSLIVQVVMVISGVIIPKFIISTYGSEVNGLISSITQFLGYIVLIEAGIGGVIQSLYYKALAQKDNKRLSKIFQTTKKFFERVAVFFIIYIIGLILIYPTIKSVTFSKLYTISLIAIIAISTLMQYLFGLSRQLLIQSDQKLYIINISKIITYILNIVVTIILIKLNFEIHIVKLIAAFIFTLSPIIYYLYVKKNYNLDKNEKIDDSIIKNRWNGFAHHFAYFIHTNIDIVLLTLFSNLKEISVYSVYIMITNGLRSIINAIISSISATFGNMIAKDEVENLRKKYKSFDYINILLSFTLFTVAGITIIPFINIYTKGVSDANYIRPVFAVIIILAEAIYSLRCSYSMIVYAGGHFKQTRIDSYIEAGINIILSIALVKPLGIVGVAIGTLCAMVYRTIMYIIYLSKNIICWDIKGIFYKYIVNIISLVIVVIISLIMPKFTIANYIQWGMYAICVSLITAITYFVMNYIFLKKDLRNIYDIYLKKLFKFKG